MEHTPIKNENRQSSTAEAEQSTRQHHLSHNKVPRKVKNKSQSSQSQVPFTIKSHSLYLTEQFPYREDNITKNVSMNNLEQKMANLKSQLQNEKKKCNKLRKLVSTKIQKQKQLDAAYKMIVMALQEKAQTQSFCFCKNKCTESLIQNNISTQVTKTNEIQNLMKENSLLRQAQQMNINNLTKLTEEIKILKRQNQILKKSIDCNIRNHQYADNEKSIESKLSHLVILNKFYENQVERLHKDKNKLEKSLIKYKDVKCLEYGNQKSKSLKQKIDHNSKKYDQSDEFVEVQMWDNDDNNNIFGTFRKQNSTNNKVRTSQILAEKTIQQSPIKLASPSFDDVQSESYKTVISLQRDSFVSIYSDEENKLKKHQSIQKKQSSFASISPLPGFGQMSSVLDHEKGNKQIQQNSVEEIIDYFKEDQNNIENCDKILSGELINSILDQEGIQKTKQNNKYKQQLDYNQSYLTMVKSLKKLVMSIDNNINEFLQLYNRKIDLTPAYEMMNISKIGKKYFHNSLSDIWIQQIGTQIFVKIKQVNQHLIKQSLRDCNNLNLKLSEALRNLDMIKEQKMALQKKNENLMQYNNKLQYEIADLGASNQSMHNSQRNTLLHGVYRSKMNLGEPLYNQQQVQCRIISTEEYENYLQFIESIPNIFKNVIKNKNDIEITQKEIDCIDIDRNLQYQLIKIINSTIDLVEKNTSQIQFLKKQSPKSEEKIEVQNKTNKMNSCNDLITIRSNKKGTNIKTNQQQSQYKNPILTKVQNVFDEAIFSQFSELKRRNQQLLKIIQQKNEQMKKLQQNLNYQKQRNNQFSLSLKSKIYNKSPENHNRVQHIEERQACEESEQDQMRDYWKQASSIRQYNDIKLNRDEEIRLLKNQISQLRIQLQGYRKRLDRKKNKIYYINH